MRLILSDVYWRLSFWVKWRDAELLTWRSFQCDYVDGSHVTMLLPPFVEQVAQQLGQHLWRWS
ncbi:MAG: hypothetical protein N838_12065 [Thiohalocapsa sp. PB-PSB1]|nr:MAG: hypothetical protein N838_12065 [Thiohalocapsa sp. PB-PSB1]